MAVLALDYGMKRIGVAVSPDNTWAFERPVIEFTQKQQALKEISSIIEQDAIDTIIVGLPVNLSGNEGVQAQIVRTFFSELGQQFPKQALHLVDERFTTSQAQKLAKERQQKNIHHADSLAARLLLEQYLAF